MFPEKTFDTGEVKINYADSETSGAPLVLLHGLASSWERHWRNHIPLFAENWHVIAPDFRGHGKSGRVTGHYQFTDYAQDTIALLDALFDEPAVLIGHSLGGVASIIAAAKAPERVRAIILLDPSLFLRNRPMKAMKGAYFWFSVIYKTLQSTTSYDAILAKCRAVQPKADEAVIRDQADQIYALDIGTVATALHDQVLTDHDLAQWLPSIACPALLIRGDWSLGAALDDEDAAFVKAHLPHIIDVKIANGTHQFHHEQRDLTMQHIQNFLASV